MGTKRLRKGQSSLQKKHKIHSSKNFLSQFMTFTLNLGETDQSYIYQIKILTVESGTVNSRHMFEKKIVVDWLH